MLDNFEVIKTAAPFTAPFINAILDTYVKPRLGKYNEKRERNRKVDEHHFISKFDEYLVRATKKQAYLRTIVFRDTPKLLEDLYIPLHVVFGTDPQHRQVLEINSYMDELIPRFHRVLLTDAAGMGKSTLLRFLFLACIRENRGIPVFVELRRISREHNVVDEILNQLNAIDEPFEKEFILRLIHEGEFVFFLDGYDEIADVDRQEATRTLQDFIGRADNNDFIISSRPEGALASFAGFQQCTIRPLQVTEAFELLRKYDEGRGRADFIIEKIEQADTLDKVAEFLTNPFLVSLLYSAFAYKPTISETKHLYYEQVYDALFESHDLSKDAYRRNKSSGLDKSQFHTLLRPLAFVTCKLNSIEYRKPEILRLVEQSRNYCAGLNCSSADFLDDLLRQVPLFIRDGESYRWSHKSIQDYFAACFICEDGKANQEQMLANMFASYAKSGKYSNVLDMSYDMGYREFRNAIIYPIVQDLAESFSSLGKASCCFSAAGTRVQFPTYVELAQIITPISTASRTEFDSTKPFICVAFYLNNHMLIFSMSRVSCLLQLLRYKKSTLPNANFWDASYPDELFPMCFKIKEILERSQYSSEQIDAVFRSNPLSATLTNSLPSLRFVGPIVEREWRRLKAEVEADRKRSEDDSLTSF